jgi:glutamate-5-semialdehyde dehydrogenase
VPQDIEGAVRATAERSRIASRSLATASTLTKNAALRACADALEDRSAQILAANEVDVSRAAAAGTSESLLDRLRLTPARLTGCADGLRSVIGLPDPVGLVRSGNTLPNGLELRHLQVPLGVIGIIYEARPNVTVDAAGLCLKAGNAVLLRGSSSARSTNAELIEVLRAACTSVGLPADVILGVPGHTHDSVKALMRLRGLVDVLIPRGGASLIQSVVSESLVPVIETGVGNCHLYVDAEADLEMALALLLDGKTSRPSVCNALETVLVHADRAAEFLPKALVALAAAGVTVHGDERVLAAAQGDGVVRATNDDWAAEYLSLDIAARVVDSYDQAVEHVRRWSSGHTEVIVTGSLATSQRWIADIDAAAVMVNASSRFTDGGEFGLGAEIGISTQKLHARGPMGLNELTTTKSVVTGTGQTRG